MPTKPASTPSSPAIFVSHADRIQQLIQAVNDRDMEVVRSMAPRVNWIAFYEDCKYKPGATGPEVSLLVHLLPSGTDKRSKKADTLWCEEALAVLVSAGYRAMDEMIISELLTEDLPVIQMLGKQCAQGLRDSSGRTILHDATGSIIPYADAVKRALDGGVDPNIQDDTGQTAFHGLWSLFHETGGENAAVWAETVGLLLDRGANPRIQDMYGKTPEGLMLEAFEELIGNASSDEEKEALTQECSAIDRVYRLALARQQLQIPPPVDSASKEKGAGGPTSPHALSIPNDWTQSDPALALELTQRLHFLESQEIAWVLRQWAADHPDWSIPFTMTPQQHDPDGLGMFTSFAGKGEASEEQTEELEAMEAALDEVVSFPDEGFMDMLSRQMNKSKWDFSTLDEALAKTMSKHFGIDGNKWLEHIKQGHGEAELDGKTLPLLIGPTVSRSQIYATRTSIELILAKQVTLDVLEHIKTQPPSSGDLRIGYTDVDEDIEIVYHSNGPTDRERASAQTIDHAWQTSAIINRYGRRANSNYAIYTNWLTDRMNRHSWNPEYLPIAVEKAMAAIHADANAWISQCVREVLDHVTLKTANPQAPGRRL